MFLDFLYIPIERMSDYCTVGQVVTSNSEIIPCWGPQTSWWWSESCSWAQGCCWWTPGLSSTAPRHSPTETNIINHSRCTMAEYNLHKKWDQTETNWCKRQNIINHSQCTMTVYNLHKEWNQTETKWCKRQTL